MNFPFRFDAPRPAQTRMMNDIYGAMSSRRNILINAPTGVGKTDASISAVLAFALENDLKVFFLTPKTSQHKIAMDAISGINKRYSLDIKAVDMVGKQNLCVNSEVNGITREAFYKACETRVKNNKCGYFTRAKAYFNSDVPKPIIDATALGHNKVFTESSDYGVCAYEISAYLAREARIIVADYAHILSPYAKNTFLKKVARTLHDSIIIWDEAHNIINSASSYFSTSVSMNTIDNAAKELKSIESGIDISYLGFAIKKIGEKRLHSKNEAFIQMDDFPIEITEEISSLSEQLEKAGMEYAEKRQAKRSALLHISRFLASWKEVDDTITAIATKRGNNVMVSLTCLYPAKSINTFREAYSNVFMSATLLPLDMHADLFGVENPEMRSYESMFPKRNKIAIVDDSVTTRYASRSMEQYKKMANNISTIKAGVPGNIAVFFPGFEVMDGVFRNMPNGSSVYVQRREMKSMALENLLKEFKASEDSMLFGVMGGSLSEGVDYANNVIKGVVVVGIPLAKPSLEMSARIAYYNRRFPGKGDEYAYSIPAVIRAIQASGRAIRGEHDRAVIVFMDRRYGWGAYSSLIKQSIGSIETGNSADLIGKFWERESEESTV